jgi:aldehyde dehydrogenase (NAD+)
MSAAPSTVTEAHSELGRFDHWIGGCNVPPGSGTYLRSINPADRSLAFEIADGTAADADAAVAAAQAAYPSWSAMTTAARSAILSRVAQAMRDNIDEIIAAEVRETGKIESNARREALASAAYFDYYAAVVRTMHGQTIDQGPHQHTYTRREPYGVVLIITPWNGPLNQGSRGMAPALAAGNTVVIKPSEFTSASTLVFARIATEAGLPDGVVNVVAGTGSGVGSTLVDHPGVRFITFTGSVSTGQFIGARAAERVVPVTLELGGKSPIIVLADADLTAAAAACATTVLANSGQVCSATTRLLVDRQIQDDLLDRVATLLAEKTAGVDFGPIITEPQFTKVLGYLDGARAEGATAVTGGTGYTEGPPSCGLYIRPTVFRDVTPDMRIAREEVFGPVMAAIPFDSVDEAVSMANATEYGLAASVWTRDGALGLRIAEQIEAGQVSVNGGLMGMETPFGGYKASGIGREKGAEALYEYTQIKTVSLALPS